LSVQGAVHDVATRLTAAAPTRRDPDTPPSVARA
jgi:hypothetical protein